MKKRITLSMLVLALSLGLSAQAAEYPKTTSASPVDVHYGEQASMTFRNQSDYTMTLRVLHSYGGYYTTVYLAPHSSRILYFSQSGSFKLKIKAEHGGSVSYHDGGHFSVTNNGYEYSEGTISFQMSTYGSGLGPQISAKEFESNN